MSGGNLPEEAGHSQYEMKSVIMTQQGELTPTKGKEGKLPDACTPPQGYKSIIKEQKVPSPKPSFIEPPKQEKSIEDSVRDVLKKIQSENKKLIEKGDELLSAKFKKKLEKQPKIPPRPKGRPPKQNKTLGPIKIGKSMGMHKTGKPSGLQKFSKPSKTGRSPGRPPIYTPEQRAEMAAARKSPKTGRSPGRPPKRSRSKSPGQAKSPKGYSIIKQKVATNLFDVSKTDSSQEKPVEIIVYPPSSTAIPGAENNAAASTSLLMDKDKVSVKEEPIDYSDNVLRSPVLDESSQGASPRLVIAETVSRKPGRPPISPEVKKARMKHIEDSIDSVIQRIIHQHDDAEDSEVKPDTNVMLEKEMKKEFTHQDSVRSNESHKSCVFSTPESIDESISSVVRSLGTAGQTNTANPNEISPAVIPQEPKIMSPPSAVGMPVKRKPGRPRKNSGDVKGKLQDKIKQNLVVAETIVPPVTNVVSDVSDTVIEARTVTSVTVETPALVLKEEPKSVYDFPESPPSGKPSVVSVPQSPTKPLDLSTSEIPQTFDVVSGETTVKTEEKEQKEKSKSKERSKVKCRC